GNLRVGVEDDVLADAVDVLGDDGVVDELGLVLDLGGELAAERDLLIDPAGELRDEDALVDVALADQARVFLLRERLARSRRGGRRRGDLLVPGLVAAALLVLLILDGRLRLGGRGLRSVLTQRRG